MITFVRHAESTANAEGRLVGRLDAELSERGRAEAERLAGALDPVALVYASPLARTRATAAAIAPGQEAQLADAVIELDYGVLDGERLADVPRDLWARWHLDADFTPEGGESLAALQRRVDAWMAERFEEVDGLARSATERVLVVSHVSPIKAAVAWTLGLDPLASFRLRLDHLTATTVGWGPAGPVLLGYNVPLSAT